MKLHSVHLRHVRQFEELTLELPASLTVIAGPNGVGKTTLQQAILAALFFSPKEVRESFVSQFDPASSPTIVLGLSRGEPPPTIFLSRSLIDDKGEWKEGATVLKGKKQALEKIQEVLPMSADAAALLLWGGQDDLAAVVEGFPSDGHSLLTAAAIQGTGADPKKVMKDLEKDIDHASKGERGGKVVGELTKAVNCVKALQAELQQASSADERLRSLREQLQLAKSQRGTLKEQARTLEAQSKHLEDLQKLLVPALRDLAIRDEMVARQAEWDGLDEEIDKGRKELATLRQELALLLSQYRVARDEEFVRQIDELRAQITAGEKLEKDCAQLEAALAARKRPEPDDVKAFQKLLGRIKEDRTRMEATGVRYEVAADRDPRTLRLAEDGQPETQITLAPGQVHRGIVGRLSIEADGLRFSAAGKEDISGLKQAVEKASRETRALLKRFEVDSENSFLDLVRDTQETQQALQQKRTEVQVQLKGATTNALKTSLERVLAAQAENQVTLADRQACAGKLLTSAAELDKSCAQKKGEIQQAGENVAALEEKRPSTAEKDLHKKNLETVRRRARESAAAFADADLLHRSPTREVQEALQKSQEDNRKEQTRLGLALTSAETKVADLSGQLKQTQPHRPLDAIREDLEEAREVLSREQVLQEARALLRQRIEEKMTALAAHVPVELSAKVTEQLARLTAGEVSRVVLGSELAVTQVGENGEAVNAWQPHQLSHGERHQTALAVKIAVARALAETSGAVFLILDDSLVTFDPHRRAATEALLLDLVADGKLQVILLTCHTDWAGDWKDRRPAEVAYVELAAHAKYYRPPPAVAALKDGRLAR